MRYYAGLWSFASWFTLNPGGDEDVKNDCCYKGTTPLHAFAFRVHTHALGRKVWLERKSLGGGIVERVELAQRDPQLPQGFEPLGEEFIIRPGDSLSAVCRFDTRSISKPVSVGHTHHDEMCNFYMMFYAEQPLSMQCDDGEFYSTNEVRQVLLLIYSTHKSLCNNCPS